MSYHQTIYNRLRQAGMTEAGALGVLGNWECENNCEPNRRQGDFSANRTASREYTAKITSGAISREQFANGVTGYGLAQWTYQPRQRALYDFWKQNGKALDDVNMQIDFALKEFKTDFAPDFTLLKQTNDIYEACDAVCQRFENPEVKNTSARYQAAQKIRYELDLDGWSSEASSSENPNSAQTTEPAAEETAESTATAETANAGKLMLRTIDERCSGWPEVWILQATLLIRGIVCTKPDGQFGSYLKTGVMRFQSMSGLRADGIVGPMTWAKLLER